MKALAQLASDPRHTIDVIRMSHNTEIGRKTVWVIVEGLSDRTAYGKVLCEPACLLIAQDASGHGGCKCLETVVKEVSEMNPAIKIFGIRDKDYIKYEDAPTHILPKNVFATDKRDLEMMLLSMHAVAEGMEKIHIGFNAALSEALDAMAVIGNMRIYSHVRSQMNFNKWLKFSNIFDQSHHCFIDGWRENLTRDFCVQVAITEEQLRDFIIEKELDTESPYDICRGHDVLHILQEKIHGTKTTSEDIFSDMAECISLEDFKKTSLCDSIRQWEHCSGTNIIKIPVYTHEPCA